MTQNKTFTIHGDLSSGTDLSSTTDSRVQRFQILMAQRYYAAFGMKYPKTKRQNNK